MMIRPATAFAPQPRFLRGAMQALGFYRRLSTSFEAEDQQPFTALSTGGTLDLFEVGERHELWDTLWGLEFLSLWPQPTAVTPSPQVRTPSPKSQTDDTRSHAPIRAVAQQPPLPIRDKRVREPKNTAGRPPVPALVQMTPAREPRQLPASVLWQTMIHKVYVPQWPAMTAVSRRRRGEQDKAAFTTIKRPASPDRPEARVIGHIPASLERAWPARIDRQGPGRDTVMSAPSPARESSPAVAPLPARTPVLTVGQDDNHRVAAAPHDPGDVSWRFLVTESQGSPLGIFQRVMLEPFFPGLNLAEIRVHADEPADRAARSIGADAFSLGRDIFFRARRFEPSSAKGLALVSHELSHTRQIIGGEPMQSTMPRRDLERDALSMEATVLRAFTTAPARREDPRVSPMSGRRYTPLRLESARAMPMSMPATSQGDNAGSGGVQRSLAPAAAASITTGGGQPLKAESSRPAAGGAGSASAGGAGSDDPETAKRNLMRMLDRKLRMDKERRGVDRWVR